MRARLPDRQLDALPSVGGQEAGLIPHHLQHHLLVGAQDERAIEDHVRRDRA